MSSFRRSGALRSRAFAWVLAVLAGLSVPAEADAQDADATRVWPTASEVTAYVPAHSLGSSDALDVDVPRGMRLLSAHALESGLTLVPLRLEERGESPRGSRRVRLTPPRRFADLTEVALRLATGDQEGDVDIQVRAIRFISGRMRAAGTESVRSRVEYAVPAPGAFAARFAGQSQPLRADAVPALGESESFTLALWLNTAAPDEVVLSTWTGAEDDAYPLDLVVDARGRLLAYQGEPGRHVALTTTAPLVDGLWHHVALTHDASSGWTRLVVDGLAVDSLQSGLGRPALPRAKAFALGGRPTAPRGARDVEAGAGYTGRIDALHVWPGVAPLTVLQRLHAAPLAAIDVPGDLALDFDAPISPALLPRGGTVAFERVVSDQVVTPAFSRFRANLAEDIGAVQLQWRGRAEAYFVERSAGGEQFELIGTVEARGQGEAAYSFDDAGEPSGVAYYRIRQRFAGGRERVSPVLKVGMGTQTEQPAVTLEGTFPNPFQGTTTLSYTVHRETPLRATVWDVGGQRVALLADRPHRPGIYSLPFDGSSLPSGTYFVRLEIGPRVLSHTMILAK